MELVLWSDAYVRESHPDLNPHDKSLDKNAIIAHTQSAYEMFMKSVLAQRS